MSSVAIASLRPKVFPLTEHSPGAQVHVTSLDAPQAEPKLTVTTSGMRSWSIVVPPIAAQVLAKRVAAAE